MCSQAFASDPSKCTFKVAFTLIPHAVLQHLVCRGTGGIGSGSDRRRAADAHRPTTFWRSCGSRGRYAREHWSLLKQCDWFVRCIMPDHRRQWKLCLQLLTKPWRSSTEILASTHQQAHTLQSAGTLAPNRVRLSLQRDSTVDLLACSGSTTSQGRQLTSVHTNPDKLPRMSTLGDLSQHRVHNASKTHAGVKKSGGSCVKRLCRNVRVSRVRNPTR